MCDLGGRVGVCLRALSVLAALREAMAAWASGRDAIVTMATGAGKSLCFQLPPLCSGEGCWSLVVSPLVALMQDAKRPRIELTASTHSTLSASGACVRVGRPGGIPYELQADRLPSRSIGRRRFHDSCVSALG